MADGRGGPGNAGEGDKGGGEGRGAGGFLPPSVEAAWGLRERPSKGPKPGLTLDRIVDTAVRVAAAEGLDAVSMGRIAKELGVSTMSLYRYVGAKRELYILMQDVATGAPPPLPAPGADWREALEQWAGAMREVYHRNLWMLRIPLSGPPATPNTVAWWEWAMVALADSGLDEGTKVSVVMLLGGFVRNEALMMADLAAVIAASGDAPEEVLSRYGQTLRRLADPERFPAVARMLDSGVMDEQDEPDHEFRFGLERILDGIAPLVEAAK
ncbi:MULTISPECIES: TetR/AcrR family transcriptional regulator [Streptomyces]|uniref:TetR/AcrR family transcriptional regulator n=1 Tax=Streptomyces TaxID=1883 RepID=UPI001316E1FE|nr:MULTISPECIES: TetR/AcrR family transcriptional regulator [Streptomyces]QGZ50142.1 TetR family transcriptional regulator [Streptomyces sp. QHH-9511]GGU03919.1 TetR family transcriptional regulator [Streptomyces lateritius]